MKHYALLLFLFASAPPALASTEAMPLTHSLPCIFRAVAKNMDVEPRADIPLPKLNLSSRTTLTQFQDAVEPQWKIRPEGFLNVYLTDRNEIYLLDDARYYQRVGRYVDDSLAHELAHYVQVKYQGSTREDDDSLETQAVRVQTWFRETYMATGKTPCGN